MAAEAKGAPLPQIRVPTGLTFVGLVAGLAAGLLTKGGSAEELLLAVTESVGMLWLQALKMTILPLVAGLLFTGIVRTTETARAGALAKRTLGLFLLVLAASAAIGISVTPLLLELTPASRAPSIANPTAADAGEVPGMGDFLATLVPENVVAAAAGGAMLPVIVFIALFALASTRLAEAPRRLLASFFEALAGAMIVLIGWVMMLAPLGVFALAFGLGIASGASAIGALAHYVLLVSSAGAIMLLGGYALGILGGRRSPGRFARALLPAQIVAVSTQSSLASLPAMLASCRQLEVSDTTSDFALPLAVALFRATSPAMNLAVAIYAAQMTGVEIGAAALAAGVFVAVLVSLSTVSLPGTASFIASVGPIALAMGVPVEPLAVLVAVEMLPDIMRTLGNVTMDVAVTATVDRDQK